MATISTPSQSGLPIPGAMNQEAGGAVPMPAIDQWNTMLIGAGRVAVPGLVSVKGSRKRKTHNKSGPGVDGGNTTDQGYQPAEFDVTIRIFRAADLRQYVSSTRGLLFPKPYKPPPVTTTYYPAIGVSPLQQTDYLSSLTPAATADTGGILNIGSFDNQGTPAGIANPDSESGLDLTAATVQATASTTTQPNPTLVPVQVYHPTLYAAGIHAIYFLEEGFLEETSTAGILEAKHKAREFLKPGTVNVSSTAQGSADITTLDMPTQPTPQPPSVTDAGPP